MLCEKPSIIGGVAIATMVSRSCKRASGIGLGLVSFYLTAIFIDTSTKFLSGSQE